MLNLLTLNLIAIIMAKHYGTLLLCHYRFNRYFAFALSQQYSPKCEENAYKNYHQVYWRALVGVAADDEDNDCSHEDDVLMTLQMMRVISQRFRFVKMFAEFTL